MVVCTYFSDHPSPVNKIVVVMKKDAAINNDIQSRHHSNCVLYTVLCTYSDLCEQLIDL